MGEIETNNRAVTDWKQDRFWFLVCWIWFPDIGPLSQPKTGRRGTMGVRRANARRSLHERVLCFGSLQLPRQTKLNLSEAEKRGRGRRSFKTASCCRSARFSKSRSRREQKDRAANTNRSLSRRSIDRKS